MTVWNKNYLANDAQPWARQVQKEIDNQKAAFESAEVNNVKRDSQLASSLRQVQTAANEANAAAAEASETASSLSTVINNIYSPGTTELDGDKVKDGTISIDKLVAGTITGDVINGGTITGATLRTAASGQRVEVNANSLDIYGVGGSFSGNIYGASSAAMQILSDGNLYIGSSAGLVEVSASLNVIGTGDFVSDLSTDGSLTRTILAGGGTTGASFNNSGNLQRTTSSQRYKTDISDLNIPYEAVLNLQPKMFKRTEEAELDPNAKFYPGFIAEDLAGTDLDIFTFYSQDENGNLRPEGIHYAELTAALVSAIKAQHQMIESLEARLATIEDRVQ